MELIYPSNAVKSNFCLSGVVGEDFIVYGTSNLRVIDSR